MQYSQSWAAHLGRTIHLSLFLLGLILSSNRCVGQQDTVRLRFEDYTVASSFKGKPKPVDLSSHRKAGLYRTVLRQQAAQGPNFAGHYTIAIWGVGTSTQAFAIVDALTGSVYFSDELPFVSWADWWEGEYGLKYRLDSNLLIVYGRRREQDPKGIFYYRWDGKSLRHLKSVPMDSSR